MTRPSAEILAVARRWIGAIQHRRQIELRNLLSEHAHLRFVGTGDGELWAGQVVREGIANFFGAIPAFLKHEETFAEAFENGDTGWACLTHELVFANQPERIFFVRTTLIFALEDGVWKIVHRHGSVPFPNMEFVGSAQTAIADLVAAAREGFSLDQREGFASIMFTDIVNSSRLASVMGDRLWSAEVSRHFAALRQHIEESGGQFVKSLGDGTMSTFPGAGAAMRAAQAIQRSLAAQSKEPRLRVRIGLHTGDVIEAGDDFFGTVVNKAARVAATAPPGEILVSDATRVMVGGAVEFTFGDSAEVQLKGLEGSHVVHGLSWQT